MKILGISIIVFLVVVLLAFLFVFVVVPIINPNANESGFNASWEAGKVSVSGSVKYYRVQGKVTVEATEKPVSADMTIVSSDTVNTISSDQSKHGVARLKDPRTVQVHLENLPARSGFSFAYDRPPQGIVVTDSNGNKIPVHIIDSDEVSVRRQDEYFLQRPS